MVRCTMCSFPRACHVLLTVNTEDIRISRHVNGGLELIFGELGGLDERVSPGMRIRSQAGV
jgi:hypothetical protein